MISRDINNLLIHTPEGVSFSLLIAGPVTRAMAWIVDSVIILFLANIASILIYIFSIISLDLAGALSMLAYFVISMGYGIVMEWHWRGQTVGKRLLRLRVMDAQGLHLQFNQVVVRNLLRFIDVLPIYYLVGGIACLINRKGQRLGDLASNTVVVWSPVIEEPDLDSLLSDKFNSLGNYPHLVARLRQKISPKEAALALQAIMRRDELSPDARIELFRELSGYFKGIVAFPQEATEGISDEQYVKNVVDVLYRTG